MVRAPLRARVGAVAALLPLLVGTAWASPTLADDLHHRRQQIGAAVHGAHADLDESSAALRHSTARLARARRELRAARVRLAGTRSELRAARLLDRRMRSALAEAVTRLRDAEADLVHARADIVARQRLLGEMVVQSYQEGTPGLMGLSMVLTSQDPTSLSSNLNAVGSVLDKQAAALARLRAAKALLVVTERTVAQARDRVARRRQAAADDLARRVVLEQQASDATAAVRGLVEERSRARSRASRVERHDVRALRRLQRQQDRITALLKKRAAAAAATPTGSGNGVLAWPAVGPVTSPYGWRIHPIFGYRSLHDGIDIGLPCGTRCAPAAGRVLAEYYSSVWGNRLVIDLGYHRGVSLAGILNHMTSYVARPGQQVARGQLLGYSGTTGWSTGCHLHFTVLVNGTAVDPMGWL